MERGCSTGDEIYPNSTGLFDVPFNSDVERFYPVNPINIRNWSEDPKCGIPRPLIQKTRQRCVIGNGTQYGEGIVLYSPEDNSCINTPLDSGVIFLLGATVILAYIKRNVLWMNLTKVS